MPASQLAEGGRISGCFSRDWFDRHWSRVVNFCTASLSKINFALFCFCIASHHINIMAEFPQYNPIVVIKCNLFVSKSENISISLATRMWLESKCWWQTRKQIPYQKVAFYCQRWMVLNERHMCRSKGNVAIIRQIPSNLARTILVRNAHGVRNCCVLIAGNGGNYGFLQNRSSFDPAHYNLLITEIDSIILRS